MSRKAVIDIGTNSIKFYVAATGPRGIETVLEELEIARLGEGLRETGKIGDEAMARNVAAVSGFAAKAKALGADEIMAVGTMALRKANNAAVFVDKVRAACGVEVQVIEGEEEARLSYLAALSTFDEVDGCNVVFDSGGGSTEFIIGNGREIDHKLSINVGALVISEEFLKSDPVQGFEVEHAVAAIRQRFDRNQLNVTAGHLVGIGGTITTMAAVMHRMTEYDPSVIQGSIVDCGEAAAQIALYFGKSIAERKSIAGLQPKRADIILGGACIVSVILEKFGVDRLSVSDRGLRHGLIFDRFGKSDQ